MFIFDKKFLKEFSRVFSNNRSTVCLSLRLAFSVEKYLKMLDNEWQKRRKDKQKHNVQEGKFPQETQFSRISRRILLQCFSQVLKGALCS